MMNFEVYPWHKLCSYLLFCFVWSGVCMDEQVDLISTHITTSDIIGFVFGKLLPFGEILFLIFFGWIFPFSIKKKSKNLPCFLHIVQASG